MISKKPLKILHLEDNVVDAELTQRSLADEGIIAEWLLVETEAEFRHALETGQFDLIISDYSMPNFDGLSALALAREKSLDVPFIYVSGTIGEERAVEALLRGATDYVLKDRLFRLGVVIRRALKESAVRAQKSLVEGQLRTTFVRLQQLLAASPAVIYSYEFPGAAHTFFVSENVRSRFGYEQEEFTSGAGFWIERMHPDDREKVLAALRDLPARESLMLHYRFRHKDGSYRWVEDRMNVLRQPSAEPTQIVGSWVDVTDLRRVQEEKQKLEDQFYQAQKLEAIGSLAGGVAHDFNNILMVILSYSEFLLAKLPQDSGMRHEVEEIRKAGNKAAALTHQLLAFSRKETLRPRAINPAEAIKNLSKMLGRLIGDNIRLSLALSPYPGFIVCDPSQFDQILINLVVNARDAMPRGGEITIEVRTIAAKEAKDARADTCIISVSDVGVGIPHEILGKIFDPFFTTKPAGKGTGLGLSMVHGAVIQNHGRLEVESDVGKGTTFRIYFPLHAGKQVDEHPEVPGQQPFAAGLTVLLVEDDESVRQAIIQMLAALGFRVISASSGEEALQVLAEQEKPIDVILTDVKMPGMSGIDLAQRIRTTQPEAKVIFCTGYLDEIESVEKGAGAEWPIVQKPFEAETILRKIQALIAPAAGLPDATSGTSQ